VGVSRFEVTHGFGRLVQRVGLVDGRGELAGHVVPGVPVQPGGVDLHEYLVAGDLGPGDTSTRHTSAAP